MTPGARISAAIEVLDQINAGSPAEKALLAWARSSRYAGSKDRAAVRDHVFDALRCRRSHAALGGGDDGRALMIGALRDRKIDPDSLFDGQGHAPAPLTDRERAAGSEPSGAAALDVPDWIYPELQASLGSDCAPILLKLRQRAEVFLRVVRNRASRDAAQAILADDGIHTEPVSLSDHALRVTEGARRVSGSRALREGLVELQDAASQAVCDLIPVRSGAVLDLCAGGGGKSLALAARGAGPILAHDAYPRRMSDLPERARRAEAQIQCIATERLEKSGPFAVVVADVPCSGSGAWRRQPDAKWRLNEATLSDLCETQRTILVQAAGLTQPGGCLAYITCSLLDRENRSQIEWFLRDHPDWTATSQHTFTPLDGGDGFFLALLERDRQSHVQP